MPAMPEGAREGILQRHVPASGAPARRRRSCGRSCSAAARSCTRCVKAQEILAEQYGVAADVWSVTSYKELYRDGARRASAGTCCIPAEPPRVPYVTQCLDGRAGRVVAASRLRQGAAATRSPAGCRARCIALGTDGFGRSEDRAGAARLLRGRRPLRRRSPRCRRWRARRQDRRRRSSRRRSRTRTSTRRKPNPAILTVVSRGLTASDREAMRDHGD